MRVTIRALLVAALLVLCIGLQMLEATGRWDQTLHDTGDEVAIVAVVLCIGVAFVVAVTTPHRVFFSAVRSPFSVVNVTVLPPLEPPAANLTFSVSPPLSLRI